jgi:acetyl coenzyme A synthetase (ADP forming)-like protein
MTRNASSNYPSQYEAEVLLKDGSRILLRPIKREDAGRWLTFFQRLNKEQTQYLHFHRLTERIDPEDAQRFCTVDYYNTFAFIAEVMKEQGKDIVAMGRYYRLPSKHSARVTLAVADAYRGKGIGTRLIEWLSKVARENDITVFEGDVFSEDERIMKILRDYGFRLISEPRDGVYHVTIPLTYSQRVARREAERERISTIQSIRRILCPRSVAVIGASRQPGSVGQIVFKSIIEHGFAGVVHPVNPNADQVASVKAYPSVLDIPGEIDLAVIVVPAQFVPRVADECGQKGVRAIIVLSDGFKERGAEGAAREDQLRDIALGHGMRLVGPNCMGVINTDPAVSLNATFSGIHPPRGNIAFLSQSGTMGQVILEYASELNVGLASFVSVGNRADISPNDLLQYWEQDPAVKVILLYLESFGNPRKFGQIAKRVAARKPVVVVKGGMTTVGSRATQSHTGSLATSAVAAEALFHQTGLIRVNTIQELLGVAAIFSNQPLPRGKRLAIVTNGGGAGVVAADASEQHGLILPEFTPQTTARLKEVIKRDIRINNPLDMTGSVSAEEFENALRVIAEAEEIDTALAIFVPALVVKIEMAQEVIRKVIPAFRRNKKLLLASFMGKAGRNVRLGEGENYVPCYAFPENAVSALARAVERSEFLQKPRGTLPRLTGIRAARAREIIDTAMGRSVQRPLWLSPAEIADLLACYGLRYAETKSASTAEEAAARAKQIGFPVVVKLDSATITHKTDVGGVVLDVRSEKEVIDAFNSIKAKLAATGREKEMAGVTVQRMVKSGIEVIAGVTQDPSFGPLIMFGFGGVYTELLKDVAVRLAPLTNLDAKELIYSIRMAKLFQGFRDTPPSDTEALQDMLLRLSALVEDIPQIAELDFNPVKVMPFGEGYWIVDARILLG